MQAYLMQAHLMQARPLPDGMELATDLLERAARARRYGRMFAYHPAGQDLLALAEELETQARKAMQQDQC